MDIKKLKRVSNSIRKNIISIVYNAKSGHIGGALGLSDIYTYLYFEELNSNLIKNNSKNRDFVIVSNGHTCPVLYSTLYECGFFKKEDLFSFRKLGGLLQGHPHFKSFSGIENSGGPLGQGISQAVGFAHSLKRDGKKNRVYCFIGDGELEEGQCWEALLYAGNYKLDNLVIILDRNHIQIDGNTSQVLSLEPLNSKIRAFNLAVVEFNGNDFNQIKTAFKSIKQIKDKAIFFIANTIPGFGVDFMEQNYKWHGKAPTSEEYASAIKQLNENDVGKLK